MFYSFSNPIERACKHSIGLKTETERTAHVQCRRNSVMTYDTQNERFFLLNKVLYKCLSVIIKLSFHLATVKWSRTTSHQSLFRTLIHKQPVLCAGRGIFLHDKYEQHGTAVYVYLSRNGKILILQLKTNKETV